MNKSGIPADLAGVLLCCFLFLLMGTDHFGNNDTAAASGLLAKAMRYAGLPCLAVLWVTAPRSFRKYPMFAGIVRTILLVSTPILMFLFCDGVCNHLILEMEPQGLVLCLILSALLEVIALSLCGGNVGILCVLYIASFLCGTINYFVETFRWSPVTFADIKAVRTAADVASGYHPVLESKGQIVLIVMVGTCFLAFALIRGGVGCVQRIPGRRVGVALLAVGILFVSCVDFRSSLDVDLTRWNPVEGYCAYGFLPSFISTWQRQRNLKPDGYSPERCEAALKRGGTGAEEEASALNTTQKAEGRETLGAPNDQKPTVIVIMNESFSDLSMLGPFACADEHLDFLRQLKFDPGTVEYGTCYVSTRGGGTPKSEFEFLTGTSLGSIPGTNPYIQFDLSEAPSMAADLKAQGYRTVAMHPGDPGNWNRNDVYRAMGFDEFVSLEGFVGKERYVHDLVSDRGDYEVLLEQLHSENGPQFLFNVTIQNHGGYDIRDFEGWETVSVDEAYSSNTDVQAFETMMKTADDALAYLMTELKKEDTPLILCFFGDHQPSLNRSFEEALVSAGAGPSAAPLEVRERYMAVPYFIWANFPVEKKAFSDAAGPEITSLNYLGRQTQAYAGLELTDHGRYVLSLRDRIPVINETGYYAGDGTWHSFRDTNSMLEEYSMVQYYTLFEKNHDVKLYRMW